MKKLKLIYNPYSGDKSFKFAIDACVNVFQQGGYDVHILRGMEPKDLDAHVPELVGYDAVVVAGGDGSLNIVLNAMGKHSIQCPLGVIPSGTANDFATFLKMPADPEKAAAAIVNGKLIRCDIGQVNNRYFINVCAAGLLTNISSQVDSSAKDSLGTLAYYLKGLGQLPNFVPLPVRITTRSQVIEENIYLFVVLNTSGTGGFEKLCEQASIQDGLFDLIAFRSKPIVELAVLFLKVLKGDYLEDSGILYLKEPWFRVESLSRENHPLFYETDTDGEVGPDMPIEIVNLKDAIELLVPATF